MTVLKIICAISVGAGALFAADLPQASKVYDQTLTNTEKEFVSLVAAMPADKFNFAPTGGKFEGVRTFAQQSKHAAWVLNQIASTLLGERIRRPADRRKTARKIWSVRKISSST